jgi:hypothetical protein
MKEINRALITIAITLCSIIGFSQNTVKELSDGIEKGQYGIVEVRLNMEDEFRTLEGRDSKGLARISFFTGKGEDKCLLSKGFRGVDHVVIILNEMNENGWKLVNTYPIRGTSLLITHYVFVKVKKG